MPRLTDRATVMLGETLGLFVALVAMGAMTALAFRLGSWLGMAQP